MSDTKSVSNGVILCHEHGMECENIGHFYVGCECYSTYTFYKQEHYMRHVLCDSCIKQCGPINDMIADAEDEMDRVKATVADQLNTLQSIINKCREQLRCIELVGKKEVDLKRGQMSRKDYLLAELFKLEQSYKS